ELDDALGAEAGDARPAEDAPLPEIRTVLELADAIHSRDASAIATAREMVIATFGSDGVVDVAGVAGIFEVANRIADGAGLELDAMYAEATPYRPPDET
ncbi:MAG: hypothetical protein L0206_25990, partial [Actinobacteria bacterium]|nr:hypothetical protein [Actinomycetota bacterium]